MLFNSYFFLLVFFPTAFLGYWLLQRWVAHRIAKFWLVIASLYFYSYFRLSYLPILLISILINYYLGNYLLQNANEKGKRLLAVTLGCALNAGILIYYKYLGFFCENWNLLTGSHLEWGKGLLLPLGISFYTFQQLSYIIDCYRGQCQKYSLLDYALFVSFFPQLIAGPIVLPSEMLPQFENRENKKFSWENLTDGAFFFACGLMKKCLIADTLANFSAVGFDTATPLGIVDAWLTAMAFTLQLYFDFSGYCDMAMGIGKCFNIELPLNFNSPYKSTDFQDFWRRWHITLGRFMMNYLYIPLGGNRHGAARTYFNLLCVFLISGLWHGAGWLFLIWGGLHGVAIVICRLWHQFRHAHNDRFAMPRWCATMLTLFFVNLFWVFFRATTMHRALYILQHMFTWDKLKITKLFKHNLANASGLSKDCLLLFFFLALAGCFLLPNAKQMLPWLKRHPKLQIALTALLAFGGWICVARLSPFLYFNF